MHKTDTIDIVYVASGAIDVVLENGKTSLATGDFLVLQGDQHGWQNPHDEPCALVITMLSAARTG
jgi:quercetin dioxygenase-like cupin family protein